MRWEDRIISESELAPYFEGSGRSLGAWVAALIEQQKQTWPRLRSGYEMLAAVETKKVSAGETTVVIQHNPGRIRSTAASVDKFAVASRRCFLCPDSLPAEEKGIAYSDDLVILCNPFPILDRHLSIVHRDHIHQKIAGNVETLLELARDLGPEFFVLYNGPECGASAPDHLHFQACERELLPIEADSKSDEPAAPEHCDICRDSAAAGFELFTLEGSGRSVIVFRGGLIDEIANWVYRIIDELAQATSKAEPMINIICARDRNGFTVYLFPRARHRPACFYAEGDERLIVSPGAIDMAGVVVVPEREHFDKIGARHLEEIYTEVSLSPDAVNDLVERICMLSTVEESM
jgi:uncharacterized protein DUF4922